MNKNEVSESITFRNTTLIMEYISAENCESETFSGVIKSWLIQIKEKPMTVLDLSKTWYDKRSEDPTKSEPKHSLDKWPKLLKGKEHLIKKLNISYTHIKRVPMLPECLHFKCVSTYYHSGYLVSIEGLPKCKWVFVKKQTHLCSLPPLPNCIELDAAGSGLTRLPKIPKIRRLFCSRCPRLQQLPKQLNNLTKLDIRMTRVVDIPLLPKCKVITVNSGVKIENQINSYIIELIHYQPIIESPENFIIADWPESAWPKNIVDQQK